MIAVFMKGRLFHNLKFSPKDKFKFIKSECDIMGITFTGVIEEYKWWEFDLGKRKAFDKLKERQPEIFLK